MVWDIIIAAGIAVIQVALTWYGVHVSVKEERLRNALIIGMVGVIGVGLTVWGTIRATTSQQKLGNDITELKKGQQDTKVGIQQIKNNPPVVNVNPPVINFPAVPQHTHAQFLSPGSLTSNPTLPFHENQNVALNVTFANGGNFTLNDPLLGALLELVPASESAEVIWRKFGSKVKLEHRGGSMVASHNPTANDHQLRTFTLDGPLSKSDADDLMAIPGNKKLCAIGKLQWRDDSGRYETRCLMCTERELDGSFSWSVGSENNAEHKLPH